jgi:tetratricopeptide (TPR) repeat protein/predicted Ser/Thr protein kinase
MGRALNGGGAGGDAVPRDESLDETLPSGDQMPIVPLDRTHFSGEGGLEVVPPLDLAPGATLGRYLIQERLGSGTMGLVLSAVDPTLDRKVAIKLVRPDQIGGSTQGRQRLQREAQAMARLAHPNVVTVFEVGAADDHVFVAMEYVDGSSLDQWLASGRSRREIIEAFTAAGRGLAAAHAAGVVHRDFKPANVLVSVDGRVRVADFGLATAPHGPIDLPPGAMTASGNMAMTATGALLGTPAYMSPEQHQSQPADARADQFSFCVALYEALYGQLPFAGEGYLAYANNVVAGRVREPVRARRVPRRLRKVLLRGLAVAPEHRYPGMRELLIDLDRASSAGPRRLALVGTGALGVGAVAFALFGRGEEPDPCARAEEPAAHLWDADLRRQVEEAFVASGQSSARATFERVDRTVSERVDRIRTMRREACLATNVRRDQSPVLLDRRMECLDRHATDVKALTAVFTSMPERAVIDRAVQASLDLPPVAECADRKALLAAVPPPDDPAVRARVVELEAPLARARALDKAGKYEDALAVVTEVTAAADEIGFAPLRARAHYTRAKILSTLDKHEETSAALRATVDMAAAARDDELLAEIWLLLYGNIGYHLSRPDEARALEPAVTAAVERAGGDPELRGQLENTRGAIALGNGDYALAAERFLEAKSLTVSAIGTEAPKVADMLTNAGLALESTGRFAEARAAHDEAVALRARVLGPDHPSVGSSYRALGALLDSMGEREEALAQFKKAVAIFEEGLPADHPTLGNTLSSVGVVLDNLERSDESLEFHRRAVAILEKRSADAPVPLSYALSNLGISHMRQGRYAEADKAYQRSLAIKEKVLGPDHPSVASTLCSMGTAAMESGDLARGKAACSRSLAIMEKRLGRDHPEVAGPLQSLTYNAIRRGEPKLALPLITRAVAIMEKAGMTGAPGFGDSLVLRGHVLSLLGRRAEAVPQIEKGLGLMKKHGSSRKDLAEAESYLARARRAAR